MAPELTHAAWADAFSLLEMACPCEAYRIVTDGLTDTPPNQPDVADRWVQLGSRINAILTAVTVH